MCHFGLAFMRLCFFRTDLCGLATDFVRTCNGFLFSLFVHSKKVQVFWIWNLGRENGYDPFFSESGSTSSYRSWPTSWKRTTWQRAAAAGPLLSVVIKDNKIIFPKIIIIIIKSNAVVIGNDHRILRYVSVRIRRVRAGRRRRRAPR